MKKLFNIYSFAFLLFLSFTRVTAQSGFSGVIHLSAKNEERGEKANVSWFISEGNHRLDFETQAKEGNFNYSLVYKAGQNEVVILTPGKEKNLYYRVPLSGFPKAALIPSGAQVLTEPGSKLVAGTDCKQYSLRSGTNSATVWVGNIPGFSAENIPVFMQTNGILGALKSSSISGIPLEFVIYNNNNEILSSQSMVGISTQTIQSNVFEIPSGYEAGN